MTKPTSTNSEIVVGLDLGSTKVTAVVGEIDDGRVEILGFGNVTCRGLRKGVVSNIEWTVRAIREAVEGLPEKYRSVFVLRDIQQLSIEETATVLGITTANVKTR